MTLRQPEIPIASVEVDTAPNLTDARQAKKQRLQDPESSDSNITVAPRDLSRSSTADQEKQRIALLKKFSSYEQTAKGSHALSEKASSKDLGNDGDIEYTPPSRKDGRLRQWPKGKDLGPGVFGYKSEAYKGLDK